tara:strand:- start:389 stop:838 length:450 start_codon:yes stop_codon:yes gene_type:complete
LLFASVLIGQSKQELTESIITYQRAFNDDWIETKLDGNKLIIYEKSVGHKVTRNIDEETIDLSKVESVAVKENDYDYFLVFIYFKDDDIHRKYFDSYEDYLIKKYETGSEFKHSWKNIVSFKKEKLAMDFQKELVALIKLCGSKNVKSF